MNSGVPYPPLANDDPGEPAEAVDNRSLEDILGSIPPPPPPAMTNEPGAPRLMITHIVNRNFKSYAGEQILGPFHKRFSCIIGPNGSGKSNVIDSMLFVFGYRAQKIRSKKLSVLIHSSDGHKDIQSCTVEVHFQKIIDKEGDDYDVIPNTKFYVSRTASKDNSSSYHINGKKSTFKDVGTLLRSHGIDLDHNRFLILQGEVEQIAMMKPKGQTEHDEGMLEYLEDIIGSCRLKEPISTLCRRVELLNEQRGEKLNRVKMVEKEKNGLEGERNKAVEFLTLENDVFKKRSQLCQFYVHDLQQRMVEKEAEKQQIQEDTKGLSEKSTQLTEEMKAKNEALKNVEKKLGKLTKFIENQKEKFTQLDLQDVEVREKLKHTKNKTKKLHKQLLKDQEKLEEVRNVPASSEKVIAEASAQKVQLEKQKAQEEAGLAQVMESLKEETSGLQLEKEQKEKELLEMSKAVNEARSQMDVAQSELDIYLSQHKTALSQLSQAKVTLEGTSDTLRDRRAAIKELQRHIPKCEEELGKDERELQQLSEKDGQARVLVGDLRQKVEEAKSSLSATRSRGKVLDALMQQKHSGKIPGILGRLVRRPSHAMIHCCNLLCSRVTWGPSTRSMMLPSLQVWEKSMGALTTPENAPRLFDMVKVKDQALRPAFYFALRDTLVAKDLEQATRVAFQKDKRWRVVTLQGQIIEQAGTMTGGGGRVMKGRMGSSIGTEVTQEQSLEEQELHLKSQMNQLEANVLAAAPDKAKQKQMEKSLDAFKKSTVCVQAGKVEAEVKRLHTLIVDINSHKLKAQQDKLDKVNKELDELKNVCRVLQEIKAIQEEEHALQKESLNVRLKVEQIDTAVVEYQNKIKHWEKESSKLVLHSVDDRPVEELSKLTAEELEAIKNPDVIKNEIALLEDRCAHMKPNLGAIAEFKKKEELYLQRVSELDEITTQRDNFKRSCEDLRKQRLNEFMAGFNIITNKLKENYQMLTLGGDAELELVDSLDPFSEGIMFSVRPPKKSWKKIYNLSGGEKTLSSLALVFALHHYKPTPLYFMDEIDAALDFKNVSIVACYIYEQTKNAQFIIISLRNNMFEMADRLIGIYKTHNTTKNVGINPKTIVLRDVEPASA
uniref:Structural maintenance of chromosomes protein 4 n=1 Tax=Electrophorus electricus TaxID=8005 RepID=A0AAY5EKU6_ELEEL